MGSVPFWAYAGIKMIRDNINIDIDTVIFFNFASFSNIY